MDNTVAAMLIAVGVVIFLILAAVIVVPNGNRNGYGYGRGGIGKRSGCSMSNSCQLGGTRRASKDGKVILFYAPWCGYCKEVKPVWDKLAKAHRDRVISINGDDNPKLVGKFGVKGYPTIVYSPSGKDEAVGVIEYRGDRSRSSLNKFINRHLE